MYKQLRVWSEAHELTKSIYRETTSFPKSELYGLTNQIRRAAISVPGNLAEGSSRKSNSDFARFVEIAHGSANELEYQLFLSFELGYLSESTHNTLQVNITKLLKGLHQLRLSLLSR
jgi:four helix bundle protein